MKSYSQSQGLTPNTISAPFSQVCTYDLHALVADSEVGDWSGNATWLLSQDQAKALVSVLGQQGSSGVVSLGATLGLQAAGKASKKGRKNKPQELHLPCNLKLKIIPRYEQIE